MPPLRSTAPLLAVSTALALVACGPRDRVPSEGSEGRAVAAEPDRPWAGAVLDEPVARPDVVLPDVEGRPFDFRRETDGAVTLLFFGYTHCPDVCPVHMANLAAVLRELPHEITRHVEVVFVTADPARDTPERLAAWLDALHPGFRGLRGTREEVTALERALGLPASVVEPAGEGTDYFVGHASQVLAFGGDGPARVVYPWGTRQRDWRRDIPRLVRETVPAFSDR